MANTTYTVVRGDTLTAIAKKYNTTVSNLVKLNDISDPDYIVVGQVLIVSGTAPTPTKNTTSRATIKVFGLQSNSDRVVYATWSWDKSYTENYQVKWYYDTGDSVWFVGTESTVTAKQSTYSAPSNAKRVKFKVKPVSKTRTINKKKTHYWTASWSTEKTYAFSSNPPLTPPTPTVTIEDYKLTAELSNLDVNATSIQFQVVRNDKTVFNTGTATIKTNAASYSCTVTAGSEYKVRCRSVRGKLYSEWSDYSNNAGTIPSAPTKITKCRATSKTSIYVEWPEIKNATSYDLEYTTNKNYFDGSDQTTVINNIEYTHFEKTGLTSGEEYFFRVRAVNNNGHSAWSAIKSAIIGEGPAAPTTWSSTTTVIVGEELTFYWLHNSEDNSKETSAQLELIIGGVKKTITVTNHFVNDEDEEQTASSYLIQTDEYDEGIEIQWRVRTAGITKEYGDWSVQRTVDVYAPPALELGVTDSDGVSLETLESFPVYISGVAGPNTQTPIGYHLSVIANEGYETVDNVGNAKIVSEGEKVYSKYFDTSQDLLVELSANSLTLENNISYTVVCTVSMNSGLTATSSAEFSVSWTENEYEPNAEIGIDEETFSASIRPYCEDGDGTLIKDLLLSVYRREYDGSFTEIATNLNNTSNTFVTDPHPALDYARYRIVAKSKTTGTVSFYDPPGYPVGGTAVILQWDEEWSSFDSSTSDELEHPEWSGSMLILPYNIDVSDRHSKDVELVEYIGRKHPVSYYGTHLGESSSWSMVIPKDDVETLYALRRLSVWTGDVYVREPSGTGYWASISVSYNQKHGEVTIPVTIDVVRVEGGI